MTLSQINAREPRVLLRTAAALAALFGMITLGDAAEETSPATATAHFGAGCFWASEAAFEQLKGVVNAESGYLGGTRETANYPRVCQGDTGHAETVRVTYDPEQISYDQLLDVFFDAHDPTTLNRQGNDEGTEYRSVIFVASPAQRQAAEAKIAQLAKAKKFRHPIVTTLEPLTVFYIAEDYHQDYVQHHPKERYIRSQSMPKILKVRKQHPDLLKPQFKGEK